MIGKSICTNTITSDVSKFFEVKNQITEKHKEVLQTVEELKQQLSDIKENCVNVDDLDSLVQDIKQSFELFVNNTPREVCIPADLLMRLEALEQKMVNMPNIELINTQLETNNKSSKVPKLNIKKK